MPDYALTTPVRDAAPTATGHSRRGARRVLEELARHRLPYSIGFSLVMLAGATALTFAASPFAPNVSLGGLYLVAVVPVAIMLGLRWAVAVSAASVLLYALLFLPPVHRLSPREWQNWVALSVYLVTSIAASEVTVAFRRRTILAERASAEQALLAEMARALLRAPVGDEALSVTAPQLPQLLRTSWARLELGSEQGETPGARRYTLGAESRPIGSLVVPRDSPVDREALARLLPALGSLAAIAGEGKQLARERLELEGLRRSDLAKTAILRAVSHDLRSPLTAIKTASESLLDPLVEIRPEARVDLLATIASETDRLDRLVEDLLDLSRLQAGVAAPRTEIWTVDELLANALASLGAAAERVQLDFPPGLPPIRVDGNQVGRVLLNLLENAAKFGATEGTVRVRVHEDGEQVVIRVLDDGPGIAHEETERIFAPFERGSAAAGRRGTGLGLAIARGFAELNQITVTAEPRASGGCFAVSIPTRSSPA
jgi:two-component system sensor histidine kinase KdpD